MGVREYVASTYLSSILHNAHHPRQSELHMRSRSEVVYTCFSINVNENIGIA